MANSGKIASSLMKMFTISLLSLCVFFADQIVCFSVNHPNAESSQLRPEPNILEAPAGNAELPAAVSLQSPRERREPTDCSRKFKTLFDSRYSKFLSVLDNGTVRGVEPRSVDGNTTLRLETVYNSVVRIKFSNGCIGVQDGAFRRFANEDRSSDNYTSWCEDGTAATGFQFRHFGPEHNICDDTSRYLKVEQNGDLSISNHEGSFFVKL